MYMYVVAYYIVFAIWEMNQQWSIAKIFDIVLLFYIATHDPTICLIWPPRGTSNVYRYYYGYSLPLNVYSQNNPIAQSVRAQATEIRSIYADDSNVSIGSLVRENVTRDPIDTLESSAYIDLISVACGLERQSNKREIVGSSPLWARIFHSVNLAFFAWLIARISQYKWNQLWHTPTCSLYPVLSTK